MWGGEKQSHYQAGREVREVKKSQIDGVCHCGYLTLKPTNAFEQQNGGLTVKRSRVRIIDDKTGRVLKRLRIPNVWGACNACANNWK